MIITSIISPALKRGLWFLGVLPNMRYGVVHWLLFMLSILAVQYFQYLYVFAHCNFNELSNVVIVISEAFYYSLTMIKVIIFWKNHRVFRELLAAIDADWRECVNDERHLRLMTTKAGSSYFCTKVFLNFNLSAAVIYFGGNNAIAVMHLLKRNNDTLRPFPLNVYFPFEAQQSPFYQLIAVFLFLHTLVIVYMATTISALLVALVLHASGQIDIICEELKSISEKISCHGSSVSTTRTVFNRHSKVILFAENIDKLFSIIDLMQIFWNTFVICLLSVTVISSIHNGSDIGVVRFLFAYVGVTMEVFVFCFAGEYLSLKSKSLSNAVYESLWYNMSPVHSKNILFMIMRSQKELTITVGGMTNLSLEAFASFMKATASYASVLNAMY